MSWTLIRMGGDGEAFGHAHREYMIDSEDDIQSPPAYTEIAAPGSIATTVNLSARYRKDVSGEWQKIVGSSVSPSGISFTDDGQGNVIVENNGGD